jgi:hypothetical protein
MRLFSAFTLFGIALTTTIDAGKASNSTHEETASEDKHNGNNSGSGETNFKVVGNYFCFSKFISKICEIFLVRRNHLSMNIA